MPRMLRAAVLAGLCCASACVAAPAGLGASRTGAKRRLSDTIIANGMGEGFFCSAVEKQRFWNTKLGSPSKPCRSTVMNRTMHTLSTGKTKEKTTWSGKQNYTQQSCEQHRTRIRYNATSYVNKPCVREGQTQSFRSTKCPKALNESCDASNQLLWSNRNGSFS